MSETTYREKLRDPRCKRWYASFIPVSIGHETKVNLNLVKIESYL